MKKIVLFGLLALAACAPGVSGNNAAEQVFNQSVALLQDRYYGFSLPKLPTVIASGQAELQKACAATTNCPAEVAQKVIAQMLAKLEDDHTYFQTPTQYAEYQRTQAGQGGSFPVLGIRSVYRPNSKARLITESMPGLAAEAAGLGRGDLIVGLNGQALPDGDEGSQIALRDLVRSGKEFTLNIRRAGVAREVRITGKLATVPSLPSLKTWTGVPSSVALLRIPDFTPPQTADLTHKLVNQAIKNGAKALILDLRSNPGGRATECISLAGVFTGRTGVIFASKTDNTQYLYNAGTVSTSNGIRVAVSEVANFTGNVAVLVDQQSASCAEITPALLQNAKRATVIGEPTYGILNTGTNTFALQDGSGLTITTVRTLDLNNVALPTRVTPNIAQAEDLGALETSAKDVMLERAVRVVQGLDASTPTQPVQIQTRVPLKQWAQGFN